MGHDWVHVTHFCMHICGAMANVSSVVDGRLTCLPLTMVRRQ